MHRAFTQCLLERSAPGLHRTDSSSDSSSSGSSSSGSSSSGSKPLQGVSSYSRVNKFEESRLDEVSLGKLIRYKRGREDDVKATEISASHSEGMAHAHKGHDEKKSKEFGDEAKWLRGKQDSMRKGIALADKKMKGKARVNASMPKHPYMEETVEEGIMDTIRLGSEGKERVRRIAGGLSDRGGNWDFKKNDFTEKGKAQVKSRLKNVKGAADYALKEEELDEAAEELDESKCNECGMYEADCKCSESVEESLARFRSLAGLKEAAKPDYVDLDKDGDKEESMKKAAADKKDAEDKKVEESIFRMTNLWKAYKG